MYGETLDFFKSPATVAIADIKMSAIATVAGKSFNGKFTLKIDFPIGYFMLPLLILTFSLKSLHTLFDKYLDHMLVEFEQNRMVQII